jgi:hypothetical protein
LYIMTWLTLELTDEEARALGGALELHLHGVRTELASADDRAYKNSLRQQLEVLEAIAARLPSTQPKTTSSSAGRHRRDHTVHPESAEDETEALLASSSAGQRNREALAANPDNAEEEAERLLARGHQFDGADGGDRDDD